MTPRDIARDLHRRRPDEYLLAIVLGSGLGGLADAVEDACRVAYGELDGFPASGVSSHSGELVLGRLAGLPVAVLSGRAHYYEHGDARAMAAPIEALAALGCSSILVTNAAGSVRPEMGPGSLMLIEDHINFSGRNPLIGCSGDRRFLDMTGAYDSALRRQFLAVARDKGVELARGVYLWFSGPSFETPAEIAMARTLGADAVGMSSVPEVILARYCGLKVAAVSSITNYGAGMTPSPLSHDQTKSVAAGSAAAFQSLVTGFCEAARDGR